MLTWNTGVQTGVLLQRGAAGRARAALEERGWVVQMRLKEDNVKDFLSAREIKWMRDTFQEYDNDSDTCCSRSPHDTSEDSGVHSTYWPTMSDTEIPPLDIGWPSNGHYKGVTRVSVYSHPPKTNSPHIKEVVRRLIQESTKVSDHGRLPFIPNEK